MARSTGEPIRETFRTSSTVLRAGIPWSVATEDRYTEKHTEGKREIGRECVVVTEEIVEGNHTGVAIQFVRSYGNDSCYASLKLVYT